ncbi:hypothetical protein N7454_005283 [Penicillium verhagenii]|nr:hypothetical protein N7454_005283 [Penicillium verhagenii]
MQPRMHYDDVAWERSDEIGDIWVRQFFDNEIAKPIGHFLLRYHQPDTAVALDILEKGAYNISLHMEYLSGTPGVIRFPLPGAVMFPEEKLRYEVAVMRYLHDQTSIPVPFVYHWGPKKSCPLEVGPYIIMEYITHDSSMYNLLNFPGCPGSERGRLNPDIGEDTLEALYTELANVLLQFSKPSFSRIGSLTQIDDSTWEVKHRPLSMGANELVRVGSLPQSFLPEKAFDSTSSYFEALADLHIAHLKHQRNDAIDSADDCRRKFTARRLFRKLARENKLTKRWAAFDKGPFKIWCDDFRPGNVLVNNMKIAGVVDLEFTYAAPIEFAYSPPWWLLIEKPEYWPDGLEDWTKVFSHRLPTFIKGMIKCEDAAIKEGRLTANERLSTPMQESWESGDFWTTYAARNSFAFDSIYWEKIDQRFFGPVESIEDAWKERLCLLSDEERDEKELLVTKKLQEMESRVLAWDPDEYTKSHTDIAKTYAAKRSENEAKEDQKEDQKEESEVDSLGSSTDGDVEIQNIQAKLDDPDGQHISEMLAQLST